MMKAMMMMMMMIGTMIFDGEGDVDDNDCGYYENCI